MLLCGLIGFVIERLAYRPLRQAPRLNVLITAIGVSLLLQNVGQLEFRVRPKPAEDAGAAAATGSCLRLSLPSGGGSRDVVIGLVDAMIIVTSAVLMIALEYLVFRTKLGTAMRAVSFDIDAAALMGVPVDRVVSFTFVLGSALAAAAGFLYALKYPGLNQPAHSIWVLLGLKAFVAAVIGGIGNVRGAVLGGFVIAFVEQFGAFYLSSSLSRRVRVRAADRDSARAAVRPAGFAGAGQGMTATSAKLHRDHSNRRPPPASSGAVGIVVRSVWPVVLGIALAAVDALHAAQSRRAVLHADRDRRRHRDDPGRVAQYRERHDGAVFVRPCGVHGAGRLCGRHDHVLRLDADLGQRPRSTAAFSARANGCLSAACIVGGCVATVAGYIVGLPSLRLRGDYLAIVTLGFGEILRVILQQTNQVIDDAEALRSASMSQLVAAAGWRSGRVSRHAEVHELCFGSTRF